MTPRTLVRAGVRVGVALLAAAAITIALSVTWPAVAPRHMQLFAHHGDLSNWPENTVEGLLAAAETGIDGLELDVARSLDGTWWLMHDTTVDRTTDGTGAVSDLTDAEMTKLTIDGGPGFDPARHSGLKVPTMNAALDVIGSNSQLILDVKATNSAAYTEIGTLLKARGLNDAYVICQTLEGASALKAVDSRFRTVSPYPVTWRDDVDVYLGLAGTGIGWPQVSFADLFGDAAMYVPASFDGSERVFLEQARRWGVFLSIVNNPQAALDWRHGIP
jgi:glycerophosphoryl diester phosphodiesterase